MDQYRPTTSTFGGQKDSMNEGKVTKVLDEQTAKFPSAFFMGAAVGSIGISWLFQFLGNKEKSHFIGQWVAPFLTLAVYDKLVKHIREENKLHHH